jgi:hypothetical protein
MTKISFSDNNLVIEIEGVDKILSLKSHIEIPITHVLSVSQTTDEAKKWLGLKGIRKIVGSNIPGLISEGTFYDQGKVFLDIHKPENTISIKLKDEKYREIIIEVENPEENILSIQDFIKNNSN